MTRAVVLMPLLLVCGCRGLFPHAPEGDIAVLEVPEVLIERISADAWSVDPDWDVLRLIGEEPDIPRTRWRLRPAGTTRGRGHASRPEPTWSANGAKSSAENAAQENAAETAQRTADASGDDPLWDRFTSLEIAEMLDLFAEGPPGRANEMLLELARRDDLVGWNAMILLAQRDPQAARPLAVRLEALVRGQHDPKTPAAVSDAARPEPGMLERASGPMAAVAAVWERLAGRAKDSTGEADPASTGTHASQRERGGARDISVHVRAAAAEGWCRVLAAGPGEASARLAPCLRAMQDERFPVTVYAELMRGLAAWLPPASIPGLPEVFEPGADGRPGPQVLREAAIESCLVYAAVRHEKNDGRSPPEESAWPQSIWRCERDESGRVRIVFGRWLAMMGQGASSPILENQLQDHDERVRQQALVSLGILGSARGREIILAEARRPNGRLRLAAIEALRHAGVNTVLEFAHDDSANVRSAVAEQLAAFPELKAALALQRMLTDRDPRVQKAAVEATTDWPRELAVPLLMYGIREGIYHTRLECTRRLHHYVDLKEFIDVEDPWAERSETLLAIARRHGLKLGLLADLQREGLHGGVNAGMHEEVRTLLRDVVDNQEHPASRNVAVRRLERMADGNEAAREEIVPVIESFLSKKEMPPGSGRDIDASTRVLSREEADGVETVYRQILPAYDAGYAAAAQLSDAESAAQVRAARELADLSAHSSLSPALIRRIRTEIRPDAGDTVFQYLLKAIENNGSDEAAQLARLALGHYSPRIRKTACRYFERHGSPRHGLWLLGALNDRDLSVQLAAIRAAGRCGHPGVLVGRPAVVEKDADGRFRETTSRQLGLRDLRHDLNHQVRFETAVAMSFLGDPEGMQQMMRYTSSPDVRVRRTAVQEIGLTGRSWFVEPLIDLAWTELNHGDDVLEREILASLDRLVAPINRPKGLARSASIPERIRGWAAWRESQAPPGDAPGSASDNPSGGVQRASQETENSTNEAAEK